MQVIIQREGIFNTFEKLLVSLFFYSSHRYFACFHIIYTIAPSHNQLPFFFFGFFFYAYACVLYIFLRLSPPFKLIGNRKLTFFQHLQSNNSSRNKIAQNRIIIAKNWRSENIIKLFFGCVTENKYGYNYTKHKNAYLYVLPICVAMKYIILCIFSPSA